MNQCVLVPDHELLQRIGRGSYGEVWLARNVMGQGRAVKIIRRDAFDSSRPFEREFAAIRRYEPVSRQADGLVNVLHVGRNDGEGVFYYVMELADAVEEAEKMEGRGDGGTESSGDYRPRTLSAELDARPRLPVGECLDIAFSLARALGTLHRAGLVHRDIKPSNIIFVHGQAKLADIGLVGELGSSRSFVGTEGYIPPEGPGQPSADFYALGRVLYEALTGQEPRRFPLLPSAALEALGSPAAQELMEVLLKSGETDPARRYQSAEAILADLALIRSGRSVRRIHAMERRWAVVKRAGLLVAALLVLAGGGWLLAERQARRESELRQTAEIALASAQRSGAKLAAAAGDPGARARWLEAISREARGQSSALDLRNDAITALASIGLREEARLPCPANSSRPAIDAALSRVAIPLYDGTVVVRAIPGGAELARFDTVLFDWAWDVMLDATGRFLSIHGRDGVLRVWEIGRPAPLMELPGGGSEEFMPDGKEMLVRGPGLRTFFYSLTTGKESRHWDCPDASHLHARVSPDGSQVVLSSSSDQSSFIVCRTDTGAKVCSLPSATQVIFTAWEHDSRHFLTGLTDGNIIRWQAEAAPHSQSIPAHTEAVMAVAAHPDGTIVASASWDRATRLTSVLTGQPVSGFSGHGNTVAFSSDGHRFVREDSVAHELILYTLERTPVARTLLLETPPAGGSIAGSVTGTAFSPDGRWFAAGHHDGVWLIAAATGRVMTFLSWGECSSVAFNADGTELIAASKRGIVRCPVRCGPDGTCVAGAVRMVTEEPCMRMAVAGSRIAASRNYMPVVFRENGEALEFAGQDHWHAAALSADGKWAAFGRTVGGARVWDTATGKSAAELQAPGEWTQCSFSPGSSQSLYIGSSTGVTSYHTGTWAEQWRTPVTDPGGSVSILASSTDGTMLAALLERHAVWLLDAHSGKRLARLGHPDKQPLESLAFSPDGATLAAGLKGRAILLWDLRRLRHELAALGLDWTDPI